ncbi:MAG: hypothetical protein QNJ22_22045 [Desulfosarcinaceae bacterium]|nr:hypothetical protein [Desulfosarcinaceae bacterium]
MIWNYVGSRGLCLMIVALVAVMAGGCALFNPKPPQNVMDVMCGAKKIHWEVAQEAQIGDFNCELGQKGMDPALIVAMKLKNVSDQPRRFKVHVFLEDMEKASGHLVPRKGKPPVVAPGAVEKVEIPFIKTAALSNNMMVVVKAMSE